MSTLLSYTPDGGRNWRTIARLPGNPGSHDWTAPGVTSARAKVRVRLLGPRGAVLDTDTSDRFFSLYRLLAPGTAKRD